METKQILNIIEIVISILLVITILLQQQGSGLGSMFGGGGESYRSKRGAEKMLFNATIIFLILFVGVGFALAILNTQ